MHQAMNSYELSKNWFNWCFENPEKISTNHTALYFYIIDHCNRLGWKEKFGLPSEMAKEAIGIKSYKTYIKALNDLIDWGFIKLIQKSSNQYTANIIAIVNFTKASTKASTKANPKQVQSKDTINKQETNKLNIPTYDEFLQYAIQQVPTINKEDVRLKYEAWKVNGWADGNDKKIKNWKSKLTNTLPYLRKNEKSTYVSPIIHE